MLSSPKKFMCDAASKYNAQGINPQSVKLSRQDFHYFATSLLNPNPNSIFHLEELVKEDISSFSDNGIKPSKLRRELVQEKYGIDSKVYNQESEHAYLETIDYFVKDFVPMLTASMSNNNSNLQDPKSFKTKGADLKKLFTNLMEFHKESTTEINILDNICPTKKKMVIETDIIQNVLPQPRRNRTLTTSQTETEEMSCDLIKKPCPYENCGKVYTTKGALSFHVRNKHRRNEPLKKGISEKFSTKSYFPSRNILDTIRPSSSFCLTPQPTKMTAIEFPQAVIWTDNSEPQSPKTLNQLKTPAALIKEQPQKSTLTGITKTVDSDNDSVKRSTICSTTAMTKEVNPQDNLEDDIMINNSFAHFRILFQSILLIIY